MPSVRQIAEQAGVSISTVSLVLNNKPGVSEMMRARVRESIALLKDLEKEGSGSVFFRDARSSESKPHSIVVLHPGILRSSQVFSELLQGIEAGAAEQNLQLRLIVNEGELPSDHIYQLYFSDPKLRPDGVLIIGDRSDIPIPEKIFHLEIPVVLVGRESDDFSVSAVGRDEEGIAFEATQYLQDLGHEGIAFVGGELEFRYTHSRLQGYKNAMLARFGEFSENWIALGDGGEATQKIIENDSEITAAIYVNDANAEDGLPIIKASGRKIPADLSVISFDDTLFAQEYNPPLTSIVYPRFQEGLQAVRVLTEKIKNPKLKFSQIVFHAELVLRESCAPPRNR